jgi:simple sugar transport system permease protein
MTTVASPVDERLTDVGLFRRLLVRPELGSVIGAIAVFFFFAVQSDVFWSSDGVATWLDEASRLGIMAVAIALLMIGGEFDLSAGVLTGSVGLTTAMLATKWGWNVWAAMLGALALALAIGLFNGLMVVRTRLPSFIITLGTFLMLQGLNLGITKAVTNVVQVSGLARASGYDSASKALANTFTLFDTDYRIAILWWIVITAAATWMLMRTRFGNWIFSVGGNPLAARSVGVPAARTKVLLFVVTALAAWFVGVIAALRNTSVQANTGIGQELIYIVAAVIGGCLLTGGYGSAIGASIGALIFGMATYGIVYAGWDSDWFKFFLGAMLLLAALTNNYVRRFAEEKRKS